MAVFIGLRRQAAMHDFAGKQAGDGMTEIIHGEMLPSREEKRFSFLFFRTNTAT
jgi:hypothetical protein